ncbi:unnamed protein product [Aphanomyces euteiches]
MLFHERSYNDVKNRMIFFVMQQRLPKSVKQIGGSLYRLYEHSPRYRHMPLFSHRAADCFVLCYSKTGHVTLQLRLSLLDCLDKRLNDPQMAIPTCTSQHKTSYALLNGRKCATFEPSATTSSCIHNSSQPFQWVM